jgi:P pilus assembly chaperone PapD
MQPTCLHHVATSICPDEDDMAKCGGLITPRLRAISLAACVWLGAAACQHPAWADSFDVRPVTVQVNGGLGTITVYNPGKRRIYLETIIYAWAKDADGRDILTEAAQAVASPPAMWVPPQSSYLVRLQLPAAAGSRELPFRVLVQQLPDRSDIVGGRVLFTITQNLAAFSEPASPEAPRLTASIAGQALVVANTGGRRARIQGVWQDGTRCAHGLLGYALAASSLKLSVPVHPGRIVLETDLGNVDLAVR